MTELPPRPDDRFGMPSPRPAPPRRPGMVTGAGTLLLISGVLAVVGGLVVLSGRGGLILPGLSSSQANAFGPYLLFAVGALDILAGWLVLRLHPAGRVLGIVIAGLLLVAGVLQLDRTGSPGLLTLALYAFVLYGLLAYGFVFKAQPPPR